MNRFFRLFLLLLACSGSLLAQNDFQDFLNQNDPNRATQASLEEFQDFSAAVTAQYDAWEQQQEEAFLAYKQQVEQQWGDFLGSTNSMWVQYSETLGARTAVDYERGEVVVETIVDGDDSQSSQTAIERNQEALQKLIADEARAKGALADQLTIPGSQVSVTSNQSKNFAKATVSSGQQIAQKQPAKVEAARDYHQHIKATFNKDYAASKVHQTRLKQAQALENPKAAASSPPGQVELNNRIKQERDAAKREQQTATQLAQVQPKLDQDRQPVTFSEKIKGKDGKTRTKVTTVIPLVPDHIQRRANQFRDEVDAQAKRFGVDPALAFAVIHTESYFNPKAKSYVPAYGLMQLVPRSGARDAYLYVYKKDKLLDEDYLYNASNNVELGCGYLKKIRDVYFKNVKDDETAAFLTIAAYNTGVGNVAKAMTGTTKLTPTAEAANGMSSINTYNRLMKKLPYDETKSYLDKVSERRKLYASWR